jgi:flagellar hook-associated protein 1 FlgK
MRAHQKSLEVIGHNVANAATEGFSRRRVELSSVGPALGSVASKAVTAGNGVAVSSLVRVNDRYLASRHNTELSNAGALRAEARALSQIELALPEPSDAGLAEQFGDFWAAWNDVANQPPWPANRAALLEQANTLTNALHVAAGDLSQAREDLVGELKATIGDTNATAGRVAELNAAIRTATASGVDPSDLADERDLLASELATMVGGTTREGEHGTVDVFVGGSALVRGDRAAQLAVTPGGPTTPDVGFASMSVTWQPSGTEAAVSSGEVAGLLKGVNDILPRFVSQLDGVASALVGTVNAAHNAGYNLAGTQTGLDFFDPTAVRASDIRISADVAGKPGQVAAGMPSTAGPGTLDGSVAQAIAKLSESTSGADATYRAMIGSLGVEAQSAFRRLDMQEVVTTQVGAERQSVSGVSIDEELASLVSSQHAYTASARVLTAVDEMLDVLLSRTGMVGR